MECLDREYWTMQYWCPKKKKPKERKKRNLAKYKLRNVQSSVLDGFSIVLHLCTVVIGLYQFGFAVHLAFTHMMHLMRIEYMISIGFYNCLGIGPEGEFIYVAAFVFQAAISILLPYVTSAATSSFLIIWMVLHCLMTIFFIFVHYHNITSLVARTMLQRMVIVVDYRLLTLYFFTTFIIIIYYYQLNNYYHLYQMQSDMRKDRIINTEILTKRMTKFTLVNKARAWGGKVQAIAIREEFSYANDVTEKDLQFDFGEALHGYGQVYGIRNLKTFEPKRNLAREKAASERHASTLRDMSPDRGIVAKFNNAMKKICPRCYPAKKNKVAPKKRPPPPPQEEEIISSPPFNCEEFLNKSVDNVVKWTNQFMDWCSKKCSKGDGNAPEPTGNENQEPTQPGSRTPSKSALSRGGSSSKTRKQVQINETPETGNVA